MTLTRRTFLRAAGVSLALPWLDALAPAQPAAPPPRRMVCICTPLGLHPAYFFPERAGRDYGLTPYLEPLREFRNDFTVLSGLAHPEVGSSHDSIYSFLTAAPHPELRAGFRNSISLDQFAAAHIGGETRFPSLALACEGFSLSWTRSGAIVPSDSWPSSVFARLFLAGRPDEVEAQVRRLRDGRSILDAVGDQAKSLQPKLGAGDRDKLDEYFNSVRDLERGLARSEEWSRRPRPRVAVAPPQNNVNPADVVGKAQLMFDLIHLALQTDSTRLITLLLLGTSLVPPIAGVNLGHHDLSHHGQDPAKIAQLRTVELEKMRTLRAFLAKLKETREHGATLLDHTTVFFSSNLGNASSHSARNLPILLAGGGFRHGQHLAFEPANSPPLSNLYVSVLQRLGINADRFGSSTGTLRGLEMVG
jgi:Protein of unknown function (DUF1552)